MATADKLMFNVIVPVVDEMLPHTLSQETDLLMYKKIKFLGQLNERAFQERLCTTQVRKLLFYSPGL
jgi:hypothetical protein